jgi:hypothetical protein
MSFQKKVALFIGLTAIVLVVAFNFVGSTDGAHAQTTNTYQVIKPDLSAVPVNTVITNIPFTLAQTSGTEDSPNARIQVSVLNQPEGSVVDFIGAGGENVIASGYGPSEGFVIPANVNRTDTYNLKFSMAGDYTLRYSLVDVNPANPDIVDQTVDVTVISSPLSPPLNTPDANGNATLNSNLPQVVLNSTTQPVVVNVSGNVTNGTIDLGIAVKQGTGTLPQITINSSNATVSIPASTIITSTDTTWAGIFDVPTLTTVNIPPTSSTTTTVALAVEIGNPNMSLSLSKGVRIVLPHQAGIKAGFMSSGSITEITNRCAADNQTTGDTLAANSECRIDVGSDLVIWTKHFTTFVAYSEAATEGSSAGLSGSRNPGVTSTTTSTTTPLTTTTTSTTTTVQVADNSAPTIPPDTNTDSNTDSQVADNTSPSVSTTTSPADTPIADASDTGTTSVSDQTAAVFNSYPSLYLLLTAAGIILVIGIAFKVLKK